MKKVLFVGSLSTNHVKRLVTMISIEGYNEYEVHLFDTATHVHDYNNLSEPFVLHSIPIFLKKTLISIPKLGVFFRILFERVCLNQLIKHERFSLMAVISIPMETLLYIRVAHKYKCKTLLVALGSDVLRASRRKSKLQRFAFYETDYVSADKEYRFSRYLMETFGIPELKCRSLGFGSDTLSLIFKMKGKYTKNYMAEKLGLSSNSYFIVCGYNASLGQRQEEIVKAIIVNRDLLPANYQVIIPLTYGSDKEIILQRLNMISGFKDLNVVLLTMFMSPEQVAFLRLITDLFIHVQATDGYNASLQEFMLAGSQCVNGGWLEYDSLERYGAPYHIIETIEQLPGFLHDWFSGMVLPITIPNECIWEIRKGKDWKIVLESWKSFLKTV